MNLRLCEPGAEAEDGDLLLRVLGMRDGESLSASFNGCGRHSCERCVVKVTGESERAIERSSDGEGASQHGQRQRATLNHTL